MKYFKCFKKLKEVKMLSYGSFSKKVSKKIVTMWPTKEFQIKLTKWCELKGFDLSKSYDGNETNEFDFHCTIIFSENEIFHIDEEKRISDVSVEIDGFEMLGLDKNIPVLRLKTSDKLAKIRQEYLNKGLKDKWDTWKPHVSLSYSFTGSPEINSLNIPFKEIIFDRIKIESIEE